mgnify:CR=1 FL=1
MLALVTGWINTYPMMYKHMIMRTTSGNLRANMMIYKQSGVDASKSGYVAVPLEEEEHKLHGHGRLGALQQARVPHGARHAQRHPQAKRRRRRRRRSGRA